MAAIAARAEEARRREEQRALGIAQAARQRRNAFRLKVAAWVTGVAIAGGLGYAWWNGRHVYHGPPNGTAECNDGWISYAEHHQGACSSHGGVYAWNR
jgi:hypothetical protein